MEQISTLVGLTTGLVSLVLVLWMAGYKMGRLELKVDTLWQFLVRRGTVEGVQRGFGEMGSEFHLTKEGTQAFEPLCAELQEFYQKRGRRVKTDAELAYLIEKEFGERILNEVCMPYSLSSGACLIAAIHVARHGIAP